MSDIPRLICERLKSARAQAGLTQHEVATRAKVSVRTVSRIEVCHSRYPTRPRQSVVIRLALATDNKPEEWLELAGFALDQGVIEQARNQIDLTVTNRIPKDLDILPAIREIINNPEVKNLTLGQLIRLIRLQRQLAKLKEEISLATKEPS